MIKTGISYATHSNSRAVQKELVESDVVDVIEWTLDIACFGSLNLHDYSMIDQYAQNNALIGHGLYYPVLSSNDKGQADLWLEALKTDTWRNEYEQVSVHFGQSIGWKFEQSTFLPVPYCKEAVQLGCQHLHKLSNALPCKLGLENLALAFSVKDVIEHGMFLDDLLAPIDGYLVLDLHNLFCQVMNFDLSFLSLLKTYPLNRVEELHISGGSWSYHHNKKVRRDTHDNIVPNEIWDILPYVINLCPNLKYIIFEQLPHSLAEQEATDLYVEDYMKLREIRKRG